MQVKLAEQGESDKIPSIKAEVISENVYRVTYYGLKASHYFPIDTGGDDLREAIVCDILENHGVAEAERASCMGICVVEGNQRTWVRGNR